MVRKQNRMSWGSNMVEEASVRDQEVSTDLMMFWGFGNVAVAITNEGLVIIDTSNRIHGDSIVKRMREKTQLPIHTIIYTHGHNDHVGGIASFMKDAEERGDPRPRIIAHERTPKRFDRYRELSGHQLHMNAIQFGGAIDIAERLDFSDKQFFSADIPYPDVTYSDAMKFKLGELTFELYHSMGEIDDNTWVYIPERNTVIAGDAVKAGMPNIGNPFKLLLRYEVEWAESMERIAGKNPEYLIPGHGRILNREETQEVCLGQAKFLRWAHDEVVRLLNKGYWLDEILEEIKMPKDMKDKRYLDQTYGCLNFVIHGIYYRYAGWYNGRPTEMFPAKRRDIAREVVNTGGTDSLLKRVKELQTEGKIQLALNVLDFIVDGSDDTKVRKEALLLKSKLLDARAEEESNGMAKNTFLRAAQVAEYEASLL